MAAVPGSSEPGEFAVTLRQLRDRAGLTQEELAERAGVTAHAVSALERGARTRPYPHTVRSLGAALELDGPAMTRLLAAVPARVRRHPVEGAPDRGTDRPVLPGSGPPPGVALSVPTTPLLGREDDLDAVVALVRGGARLVTLVGPGGVGKTRLVADVAQLLAEDHPDGVVTLPLASVTQAGAVVPAIARALGVAGGDGPSVRDAVTTHLAGRRTLLVLDNLEQLLGAGPDLAQLAGAAPGSTLLVTSRAALRVRGEQEYVVEPLALPRPEVATADDLTASPAGALALQRARAVNPRLRLADGDARALGELCHRLAGLPLAIELASAHLRLLSPGQLLQRLDVLTATTDATSARDLPERQRTMRATLDWSYGLLSVEQQRLFRVLGVFRGGAGLEAVESVIGPGPDAVGLLSHLVEHSMVVVRAGPWGEARYVQLEPVAQYARSLLVGEEAAAAARAHAAYFCALAEEAELGYEREDQVRWLQRMEVEEANVLIAVDRSRAEGGCEAAAAGAEIGARTVWAMWLYWWLRGQVVLGRRKAEAFLAADVPEPLLGRVRLAAATMAYAGGDGAAAAGHWEAALDIARRHDDPELAAKSLSGTGLAALASGDLPLAERRFTEAIELGPDPEGRTWMESLARIWLGTCLILRGEHTPALESVGRGLDQARARGDRLTTYIGLYNLSQAALASGDLVAARSHLREGITLSEQTGDSSNLAYFLETLAVVEAAEGRARRVARLLGAAASLRESEGGNVYAYYQPDESLRREAEDRARAELGPEEFDDELDRGRAEPGRCAGPHGWGG